MSGYYFPMFVDISTKRILVIGGGKIAARRDDKSLCDFYFPAVTEKDGVVIGMNSGGKSPKTVRKVREYLEGYRESYEYKNE